MKHKDFISVNKAIKKFKEETGMKITPEPLIQEREVKYPCVIFDLDGTLADVSKRREAADHAEKSFVASPRNDDESYHIYNKRLQTGARDAWWRAWQDPNNIKLDVPNKPVVAICSLIKEFMGCAIIITSARTDRNMTVTKEWLHQNRIYYDRLFMRPDGDFSRDDKFKKRMLDRFIAPKYEVQMVFDDRNQVVDMWRKNNITCLQVAAGDF